MKTKIVTYNDLNLIKLYNDLINGLTNNDVENKFEEIKNKFNKIENRLNKIENRLQHNNITETPDEILKLLINSNTIFNSKSKLK